MTKIMSQSIKYPSGWQLDIKKGISERQKDRTLLSTLLTTWKIRDTLVYLSSKDHSLFLYWEHPPSVKRTLWTVQCPAERNILFCSSKCQQRLCENHPRYRFMTFSLRWAELCTRGQFKAPLNVTFYILLADSGACPPLLDQSEKKKRLTTLTF